MPTTTPAQPKAAVESNSRRLMMRSISTLFLSEKPLVNYDALLQPAMSFNIKDC
jgi:hypothetical protein